MVIGPISRGSSRAYVPHDSNHGRTASQPHLAIVQRGLGVGPAAIILTRSRRHPRERVLNALTMLLWDNEDLGTRLPPLLEDGHKLRRDGSALDLIESFRALWQQVR